MLDFAFLLGGLSGYAFGDFLYFRDFEILGFLVQAPECGAYEEIATNCHSGTLAEPATRGAELCPICAGPVYAPGGRF